MFEFSYGSQVNIVTVWEKFALIPTNAMQTVVVSCDKNWPNVFFDQKSS